MMKSDTAHGMSCKTLLISLVLLLTAAGLTAQTGEESQERLKSIEIAYTDYTEGIDASYDDAGPDEAPGHKHEHRRGNLC